MKQSGPDLARGFWDLCWPPRRKTSAPMWPTYYFQYAMTHLLPTILFICDKHLLSGELPQLSSYSENCLYVQWIFSNRFQGLKNVSILLFIAGSGKWMWLDLWDTTPASLCVCVEPIIILRTDICFQCWSICAQNTKWIFLCVSNRNKGYESGFQINQSINIYFWIMHIQFIGYVDVRS